MSQSNITFTPKGPEAPQTAAVRAAVLADWQAAFDNQLNPDGATPQGQLITSETAAVQDKNNGMLYLINQFNPDVNEGIYQDAIGRIYFLDRHPARATTVSYICGGLSGTVIAAASLLRTEDGVPLASTEEAVIGADGTVSVTFSAVETGPIPVPADIPTTIVTVTPGWDTARNPTAGSIGRNVESRLEFETRRRQSVAKNAHGSVAAIYAEIASIQDVIDLAVLNNDEDMPVVDWGVTVPAHSIYASVLGGESAGIAEALYRKKDAGCGTAGNTVVSYTDEALGLYPGAVTYNYRIQRPDPLRFGIQVTIRESAAIPADYEERIKAALLANFSGADGSVRVRVASMVYASRFYCPVISAGVPDLVGIKLAAPAGSAGSAASTWADEIRVRADQAPVLDADDISIIIARQA